MNGRGIGLYLCHEFIRAMHGSISANAVNNILEIRIQLHKEIHECVADSSILT